MPSLAKMSSNAAVHLASRSRMRNRKELTEAQVGLLWERPYRRIFR
jgi:hypothetical protein